MIAIWLVVGYLGFGVLIARMFVPVLMNLAEVREPEAFDLMKESLWVGYLLMTAFWLPFAIYLLITLGQGPKIRGPR